MSNSNCKLLKVSSHVLNVLLPPIGSAVFLLNRVKKMTRLN